MKYFISYRYAWSDLKKLKDSLIFISDCLEKNQNSTFIFFRDLENWWKKEFSLDKIMKLAFQEIDNSDIIFVFIDSKKKSEWMLLECWYAKAKWKKIILAIKKWLEIRLLKTLADKIIEFKSLKDLKEKINK